VLAAAPGLSAAILCPATVVLISAAGEIGNRAGLRHRGTSERTDDIGILTGAALELLALLLAISGLVVIFVDLDRPARGFIRGPVQAPVDAEGSIPQQVADRRAAALAREPEARHIRRPHRRTGEAP
jgi:hypothetical protein